ncbi:hypothetical protein JOD54_004622 [Actinokineospora baliensis]|uniref:class I SAM-dependent methyltransferase n=1 Tax=Actinokineospora baliensis TaxID=547056 RepID=UPI00195CB311|nr:methyltransferase domain-containing protein [Actinokineospora baliensis]MBM7774418.1 hypothetical protein [Actinokineospora baliensis]
MTGDGPHYRLGPGVAAVATGAGGALVRVLGPDRVGVSRPGDLPLRLLTHFAGPRTRESWVDGDSGGDDVGGAAARAFAEALEHRVLVADGGGQAGELDQAAVDQVAAALIGHLVRLRAHLAASDPGTAPPGDPALVLHLSLHLVRELADQVAVAHRARSAAVAADLAEGGPVRLHLGCGEHPMAGWVNIDLVSPAADLRVDVRDGLPFADDSAEAVYIAHLLEHLEYPADAGAVLAECVRVLAPGAVLRVAVPDIAAFARAYVEGRAEFFAEFERRWERAPSASPLAAFLHYAGAGEFPWVADRHRFGYDEATLAALLAGSGLVGVRRCVPGDSRVGDPRLDYSWANEATGAGLPYTLIMEGEVPR